MDSDDEFEKTLSMLDEEEIQQAAKKPRIDPELTTGRSSREGRSRINPELTAGRSSREGRSRIDPELTAGRSSKEGITLDLASYKKLLI